VLTLQKAVAGYDNLHLDALLQKAAVTDALQGQMLENQAVPYRIPLPLEELWHSSNGYAVLYASTDFLPADPDNVVKDTFWWVKAAGQETYLPFAKRKKDNTLWQPDEGSGVNKAYRVPLPTTLSRRLIAYGKGDIAEVARLLALTQELGVGKKTSIGFGAIEKIEVTPLVGDFRLYDLDTMRLLRPVPMQALPSLGLISAEEEAYQQIGFTPPYWLPYNHTYCLPTGSEAKAVAVTKTEEITLPVAQSLTDFLIECEGSQERYPSFVGWIKEGAVCALTGRPIEPAKGAVPKAGAISSNMGNVVDFLKAPDSEWLSHSAALILSQPKKWHRNMAAVQGVGVLWPTLAVDATTPTQERPLWREVVRDLATRYQGRQAVIVYTSDPKSRIWPRARITSVGNKTLVYAYDPDLNLSSLLSLDVAEWWRQIQFVEELLEMGFGKFAIRDGLFAKLDQAQKRGLAATSNMEKRLQQIRPTQEFLLAWSIARQPKDLALRKG
jgi:hypothetical protein